MGWTVSHLHSQRRPMLHHGGSRRRCMNIGTSPVRAQWPQASLEAMNSSQMQMDTRGENRNETIETAFNSYLGSRVKGYVTLWVARLTKRMLGQCSPVVETRGGRSKTASVMVGGRTQKWVAVDCRRSNCYESPSASLSHSRRSDIRKAGGG